MKTIYEPSGKAREYAAKALNVYRGCGHRCVYCYAPYATRTNRAMFHSSEYIKPRPGILEALAKEAPYYSGCATPILLSFTCDPYQPTERELSITRQALEILAANNCPFTILTKGGSWGLIRDMDLIKSNPRNEWAVTLTHDDVDISRQWEPGAALPQDRIESLRIAHDAGITTWVSLEPVIDPEAAYRLVESTHSIVDYYRVGKLNYHAEAKNIDWAKFRVNMEILLKSLNKRYIIKNDLGRYNMSEKQHSEITDKRSVKDQVSHAEQENGEASEVQEQPAAMLTLVGIKEILDDGMP